MKLAIITCKELPLGVKEDQPLFDALSQLNIDFQIHAWDAEINWCEFDACLLRSVWDYHFRIDEFNAWLSSTAKLSHLINSPAIVEWNQNKTYLKELAQFGISIAPTHWLKKQQTADLSDLLLKSTKQSFFLKPTLGANSSDTLRFENNAAGISEAQIHLDNLLTKQTMMLQPYLKSVETFGETSAIFFSGDFSHAVRKIPVTGDYRVQDSFGATDTIYQLNNAELTLAHSCLKFITAKFGEVIYARLDFLHGEDGNIYLNEAELIEPSLFFNHDESSAMKMAVNIQAYLNLQTMSPKSSG